MFKIELIFRLAIVESVFGPLLKLTSVGEGSQGKLLSFIDNLGGDC